VSTQEASNFTSNDTEDEFARSLDEKFHAHNYWGGALEKTLMDADVSASEMTPSATPDGLFRYFFRFFFGRGGIGFTPFLLPEGSIVPPEATHLEVTITWAQSLTITGLRLAYSNASSENIVFLDPLPPGGGTYNLTTTLEANDIPHTTVSKWRFFLAPTSERVAGVVPTPAIFNGTAHVLVKAHRNDTLYIAPPHPDFWKANTTLPIATFGRPAKETDVVFPAEPILGIPGAVTGDEDPTDTGFSTFVPLPNNTIVPPHTGLLTIVLTWKNNSTLPNPLDLHPAMLYSPANTFRLLRPTNEVREGDQITYTVEVDPRMWDSPYTNHTNWAFFVYLTDQTQDINPAGFPLNVGQFDGRYDIAITAEREQI
jgi:hypothetical protein